MSVSAPASDASGAAPAEACAGPAVAFDPDRGWRLHRQVSVRPEPFGALLYHFGTRKLSFLKNSTMVLVVQSLAEHADARSACRAAGVDGRDEAGYFAALALLAASSILVPQERGR